MMGRKGRDDDKIRRLERELRRAEREKVILRAQAVRANDLAAQAVVEAHKLRIERDKLRATLDRVFIQQADADAFTQPDTGRHHQPVRHVTSERVGTSLDKRI